MTFFTIWLSAAASKKFATEEKPTLCGQEVRLHEPSGQRYVRFHFSPINPARELPQIASKYVRHVTFEDTYTEGLRMDGMYHFKGAIAQVTTTNYIHTPSLRSEKDRYYAEARQTISITAGSLRTVREIYRAIRSGTLQPTERWGISVDEAFSLHTLIHMKAAGLL